MNKRCIITLVIGLIIGLSLSGIGTYAATNYAINASKVAYSDNSNLGVDNVQAALDGTCVKFNNQLKDIRKSMYPVGSIYFSATLSTPDEVANVFGGEWEVYGKGKTLVGVDEEKDKYSESNKEGGKENVTLSAAQIPNITTKGTTDAETTGSTGSGYSITNTYSTRTTISTSKTLTGSITMHNAKDYTNIAGVSGVFSAGYVNNNIYLAPTSSLTGATSLGIINIDVTHSHNYNDYYTSDISGVAAHTHTIPSLSVTAKYTNTSQESINIQNPYITVYMYKRIK